MLLTLGCARLAPWRAQPPAEPTVRPVVTIHTSIGTILVELRSDQAPQTVANFLRYVEDAFYEGIIFHRVIDGFIVQGGAYTELLLLRVPRAPLRNEARPELRNRRGTLAMARSALPHSATSQFFFNLSDNPHLDRHGSEPATFGYAVFGAVIGGMDVVDRIGAQPTGSLGYMDDLPDAPVVIERVVRHR